MTKRTAMAKETPCPVCGSAAVIELYPSEIGDPVEVAFSYSFNATTNKIFRTVRCRDCTHVYCTPIPEHIDDNYTDVVDHEYLKQELTRRLSGNACLEVIKKHVRAGKLLDFGCATGDFLASARDNGFTAEGIELSRWSGQLAEKKGFPIYRQSTDDFSRQHQAEYDVVTQWGVIEHLPDPALIVRQLRDVLRTGGIIAIWTGNPDGMMSRLLGRKWWWWMGQHIQYFTSKSLRKLLDDNGYEFLEETIYPYAASYETVSNSLRRYPFNAMISALIKPFFFLKSVWYLRLPGEMYVLARKR
jgi:2-polyprenyl-3-methyl-5-hydroxy-6-metoxy-1,4-benzoquinol methylase